MTTEATPTKEPQTEADVERTRSGPYYRPNVDIVEQRDELLLVADMPGAKGRIDIRYEDGQLTIRAEVHLRQGEGQRYLCENMAWGTTTACSASASRSTPAASRRTFPTVC